MNKNIILYVFVLMTLFVSSASFAQVYNQQGDFSVEVDNQKVMVFNDEISTSFELDLKNLLSSNQDFEVVLDKVKGWDISKNYDSLSLSGDEVKTLKFDFKANSDFDYSADVVSPDELVFTKQDDYKGYFKFPLTLVGENENVTIFFEIEIESKESLVPKYEILLESSTLSPVEPLKFGVKSENVFDSRTVKVSVFLDDLKLSEKDLVFSQKDDYKSFLENIPSSIDPNFYNLKIVVRQKSGDNMYLEWDLAQRVKIKEYSNIVVHEKFENSFVKDKYYFNLDNLGNIDDTYEKKLDLSFFERIFLVSSDELKYNDSGVYLSSNLAKGEVKDVRIDVNYVSLYVIILVILVLVIYIYIRKNSNPLDVECEIYEVKKVEFEGVKSLKVRVGFENIKQSELDVLKVVFRMPSYLNVEDDSFLLSEPNSVLKSKSQYKLIWNFKRFENGDSRVLGFTLVNQKGILGDVKLPDLELEVKIAGKTRKYFSSFPVIKG